jgi:hypothetical protein
MISSIGRIVSGTLDAKSIPVTQEFRDCETGKGINNSWKLSAGWKRRLS